MLDLGTLRYKVTADTEDLNKAEDSLGRYENGAKGAAKSTDQYNREQRNLQRETRKSTNETGRLAGSFRNLARQILPIASVAGLAMAMRNMTNTFADFQSGMARVNAVSRATQAEFESLTATARRLGATTEFTGTQAASGLEFLARAGWSANESISALPAVLNLATAASMDLGAAADVASNIMSAFGIAASEASSVADVLAAASSRANTDVQQLGSAMAFVGPVAAALKIPMGDAAAAVGALSDAGIQGSAAGTGLRRVLSSLANPTSAAAAALQSLGVELETVNPATNSLVDIVDRLSASGMSAADALTIFGDRGGPAILALVENNAKVRELSGGLRDVAGESERMAGIMRDTLSGDLKTLGSAMQDLSISVGQGLNDSLRSSTQSFTRFVRYISSDVLPLFTSGQFSMMARSVLSQFGIMGDGARSVFSQIVDDFHKIVTQVTLGFDIMWQYAASAFPAIANEGSSASDFIRNAFLNLPANVTAIVRIMGVEFGFLVDYVKNVGIGIADIFSATFSALVESAKETGFAIGRALNPFQQLGDFTSDIAAAFSGPMIEANNRIAESFEVIRSARRDSIGLILEERDEAVSASADMRKQAMELRKEYERNAKAISTLTGEANGLKKAMDDLGEGGSDKLSEGAQKIIDRLQDQYNQLVLNEKQYLAVQLAAEGATSAQIEEAFRLHDALTELNNIRNPFDAWAGSLDAVAQGIGQMRSTMDSGTKQAERLGVAMQALAVVQGIVAVLTQGTGDPYTAFARMAAMAVAVGSLGVSIGSFSGGGGQREERQATQGTGTVLGDASAQSESILKATDITANATSQLVGINRAQLTALQAMSAGIESVAVSFARGGFDIGANQTGLGSSAMLGSGALYGGVAAMAPMIGGLGTTLVSIFREPLNKLNKALWRASTDMTDSGIQFLGQSLGSILDGGLLEAMQYADIETKKKALGITYSRSGETVLEAIEDESLRALTSVFMNMGEAVRSGAEALGIAEDDINQRLREFEIATQMISLQDLDADEQQAAIEAVFSSIFDGMASAVVPYIDEFAQLGEGAGETLARIATQVQVAEEAMTQLGSVLMDGLAGQDIVQMSDDLIRLSGGLESFITGFTGFVDKFATDEHKLSVATNAINSAMSQLGLEVPQSEEALWDLMQTLTDPAQIAGLLRLQDSFVTMFNASEQAARATERLAQEERDLAQARVDSAMQATDAAMNRLRASVQAQKDIVTHAYEAETAVVQDAFESRMSGMQSWADRTRNSMQGLLQITAALESAVQGNIISTAAMEQAQRRGAQAVIARALATGNLSGVEDAAGVLGSGPVSGSRFDMQFDAAVTANQLNELAERTGAQASVQEQTLDALDRRIAQAQSNHESMLSAMAVAYNAEIAGLDKILTDEQERTDLMRGIDTSAYSINESLAGLDIARAEERQARIEQKMIELADSNKALLEEQKAMRQDWQRSKERELEAMEDEINISENQTRILTDIKANTAA